MTGSAEQHHDMVVFRNTSGARKVNCALRIVTVSCQEGLMISCYTTALSSSVLLDETPLFTCSSGQMFRLF